MRLRLPGRPWPCMRRSGGDGGANASAPAPRVDGGRGRDGTSDRALPMTGTSPTAAASCVAARNAPSPPCRSRTAGDGDAGPTSLLTRVDE